jgi:hypothetical protein
MRIIAKNTIFANKLYVVISHVVSSIVYYQMNRGYLPSLVAETAF